MTGIRTQGALERIAWWAAGLRLADIPWRVIDKVRLQVGTSVSSAALSPWHEAAQTVRRARKSRGKALIYATRDRVAPLDAAYVNSAFSMSLDYDDYLLSGHPSHSAVLVPLAYARRLDDVIVAATAANEVMGRLSTACLIGPLNGQMTSYIHNVGAALALGKVRGFDAGRLAAAMGLALYQPNFCLTPGFWNEGSKTVTASMALEQGIRAAQLAEAGLDGPLDVLEHPMGFPTFFAFARFPGLFEGFGKVWFSDTLSYKRYPGTSYISAAVEGALRMTGGEPVCLADVDAVRVETTLLSSTVDSLGAAALARDPLDANAINFSIRASVAAALLFGDLTPAHMRPGVIAARSDEIRALAGRVTVEHDVAQTIRLFTSSSVGLAMFANLGPAELARLVAHARRANQAAGKAGRNPARLGRIWSELLRLLRSFASARGRRVSASDLDAAGFRMYQSARTHLTRRGRTTTEMVDIPMGACGRDTDEARQLVRWRCDTAFGAEGGAAVWELLFAPDATVTRLEEAAVPDGSGNVPESER